MDRTEVRKQRMSASAAPFVPGSGSARVAPEAPREAIAGRNWGQSPARKQRGSVSPRERSGSAQQGKNWAQRKSKREAVEAVRHDKHAAPRQGHQKVKSFAASHEPLPFSRERFVQTNFSFCVRRDLRNLLSMDDADVFVNWDSVEMVVVPQSLEATENQRCPVCLEDFVAPRMTSCGHVYCYLCLLRVLSYSAEDRCRCPLCANLITAADLKTVDLRPIFPVKEKSIQSFRLLARPRNAIIPGLYEAREGEPTGKIPTYEREETSFARYLYTNEAEFIEHLDRQGNEILMSLKDAEDEMQMRVFAEIALANIRSLRCDMKLRLRRARAARRDAAASTAADEQPAEATADAAPSVEAAGSALKFIYQAANGEKIFLHPINVKCLLQEFQSYREFPPQLEGEVLEMERFVMSEDTRKRYRFLSHLPVGCEFGLCEIDLSSVVDESVLEMFESELQARRDVRSRRAKIAAREDRERLRSSNVLQDFENLHQTLFARPLPRELESMDLSDMASFPSLGGQSGEASNAGERSSECDSPEPTEVATEVATEAATEADGGISSYASITRNMGFFPSLGEPTSSTPEAPGAEEFPGLEAGGERSGTRSGEAARGQGAWEHKLGTSPKRKGSGKKHVTLFSTNPIWSR